MHRKKQIIYTAHCILNQNSVIRDWERSKGAFNDIVKIIIDNDISIIQFPCPEFIFLGENRPPMTKKEYDIYDYRNLCENLVNDIVKQMDEYLNNGYEIIGILGIEGSPSCDSIKDKGIFMEELYKSMENNQIYIKTFDIPENYEEGKDINILQSFKNFIKI